MNEQGRKRRNGLRVAAAAAGLVGCGLANYALAAPTAWGAKTPADISRSQFVFLFGLIVLTLVALLAKAGRVAAAALLAATLSRHVERARASAATWPVRLFLLGAANGVAGTAVILALLAHTKAFPLLGLLALVLFLLLIALALLGIAGIYGWLGGRLAASPGDTIPETVKGGIALEVATLVPVLGFFAEIAALALALGAGTFALFSGRGEKTRKGILAPPQGG